jgi:N-acetylglucosaminyldiphosphoundecaprenol N-acetyl-beta-D-mannosaminyltransferase
VKENLLGISVCSLTYEELTKTLLKNIEQHNKSFIVAINPEKIMKAQEDHNLKKLLNRADFQIPDGMGVIVGSIIKGGRIRKRVTGIDLMLQICEMAATHHKRVFLYGGKPDIVEKAKDNLIKYMPGIQIVGVMDGYEKDEAVIIETINASKPDIIFVALGSPKQEYWIVNSMDKLSATIFQGVGGSFDVISGRVKRAPLFFQYIGLEWMYRLIKEPTRWKRQKVLPKFIYRVLKEKDI